MTTVAPDMTSTIITPACLPDPRLRLRAGPANVVHVTLLTAVGKPQRARPQAPGLPVRPERTQFAESQVSSTVPRPAVGYGAGTATRDGTFGGTTT
jgi:hypothetical protein